MDKFRFRKMLSYSRRIINKPFESTLELKDGGGLSRAVRYIITIALRGFIYPLLAIGLLGAIILGSLLGDILLGLGILLYVVIAISLFLIAIIFVELIKMLAFTFIFQRLSGLQGSTVAFGKVAYSFALFWVPLIVVVLLSMIFNAPREGIYTYREYISNLLQPINLILLLVKGVIMYYYFSRIGMAVTELPHRKIIFSTISSIVFLLLVEQATSFSILLRIMSAINQVMFG